MEGREFRKIFPVLSLKTIDIRLPCPICSFDEFAQTLWAQAELYRYAELPCSFKIHWRVGNWILETFRHSDWLWKWNFWFLIKVYNLDIIIYILMPCMIDKPQSRLRSLRQWHCLNKTEAISCFDLENTKCASASPDAIPWCNGLLIAPNSSYSNLPPNLVWGPRKVSTKVFYDIGSCRHFPRRSLSLSLSLFVARKLNPKCLTAICFPRVCVCARAHVCLRAQACNAYKSCARGNTHSQFALFYCMALVDSHAISRALMCNGLSFIATRLRIQNTVWFRLGPNLRLILKFSLGWRISHLTFFLMKICLQNIFIRIEIKMFIIK